MFFVALLSACGSAEDQGEVDTTPDPFNFVDQRDVPLNTDITSNSITVTGLKGAADISVTGIDEAVVITVTGGMYSIDGDAFTDGAGTVDNGQIVAVKQTSSASFSTTTDATLIIGGVSDTFFGDNTS